MTSEIYGPVSKAVDSASYVGHQDPATLLAMVVLALGSYIFWSIKQDKSIRKDAADANGKIAEAMAKLAQEVAILRAVVQDCTKRRMDV